MNTSRLALICLALFLAFGCSRPKPSAEYEQARRAWSSLFAEKLNDAYLDPQADEVLALLAKVAPDSLDAPHAASLRKEIESERARLRAEAEAFAKGQAEAKAAMESAQQALFKESARPAEVVPASAEVADAPDAGAPEETQPKEGMDASEFHTKFSRCFEYRNAALVGGMNGGEVWGLKNLGVCRELHPGFQTKAVLLYDGKVTGIRPAEELAPKKYKQMPDGRLVPLEEADTSAR